MPQEDQVSRVFLSMRMHFHPPKQTRRSEWNRHALHLANNHVPGGFCIIDSGGRSHEINHYFIGHANNDVFRHIARVKFPNGSIRKYLQSLKYARFILQISCDDQIDVAGLTRITRGTNREATHDHVVCSQAIEFAAQIQEILDSWLARLQL